MRYIWLFQPAITTPSQWDRSLGRHHLSEDRSRQKWNHHCACRGLQWNQAASRIVRRSHIQTPGESEVFCELPLVLGAFSKPFLSFSVHGELFFSSPSRRSHRAPRPQASTASELLPARPHALLGHLRSCSQCLSIKLARTGDYTHVRLSTRDCELAGRLLLEPVQRGRLHRFVKFFSSCCGGVTDTFSWWCSDSNRDGCCRHQRC